MGKQPKNPGPVFEDLYNYYRPMLNAGSNRTTDSPVHWRFQSLFLRGSNMQQLIFHRESVSFQFLGSGCWFPLFFIFTLTWGNDPI